MEKRKLELKCCRQCGATSICNCQFGLDPDSNDSLLPNFCQYCTNPIEDCQCKKNANMKYNTIFRVGGYEDEGTEFFNFSFVTPDHQEHEITVRKELFNAARDFQAIPAEYSTHPACCEHPKGCPEETNTEKLLREFNEEKE